MGSQVVLLICIGVTLVPIVTGLVWEFGADNIPTAAVVTEIHGQFTLFEKSQDINLVVPPCRVITYVKVIINNYVSKPMVYYDQKKQVVTIHYALWQFSPSTFDLVAKAAWIPGCDPNPRNVLGSSENFALDTSIQQGQQSPPVQPFSYNLPMPGVPQDLSVERFPVGPPGQQSSPIMFPQEPQFQPTWQNHKVENRFHTYIDKKVEIENEEDSQNTLDSIGYTR